MKHIHVLATAVLLSVILFSCEKEVPAELNVTTTELSFYKEGGSQSVGLTTNKNWTASSSASWLQVTPSGSSDADQIHMTAEANPELEDRSAAVVIQAGDKSNMINIIQRGDGQLYIPDANFRTYCLANFDANNDGQLSYSEAAIPTAMICSKGNISSLEGIEHFTALKQLICDNNQLTSLDVSKNTALISLDCSDNHLISLDVSKNTALTELTCSVNQLTSLDVSNNTALISLNCYNNQLTSLDVSKNTVLEQLLYCGNNQLTSLDVSKNTVLSCLWCDNNQLTSLDVSKNTELTNFTCDNNQLTSLDVSKNTLLKFLYCGNNQLTSLDISKNTALKSLFCEHNQLTSLDVSNSTELYLLWCNENPDLTEIWLKSGQSISSIAKDTHTEIKHKP